MKVEFRVRATATAKLFDRSPIKMKDPMMKVLQTLLVIHQEKLKKAQDRLAEQIVPRDIVEDEEVDVIASAREVIQKLLEKRLRFNLKKIIPKIIINSFQTLRMYPQIVQ